MSAVPLSELGEPHPGWCHIRHGAAEPHRSHPRSLSDSGGITVWVTLRDSDPDPTVHVALPGADKPVELGPDDARRLAATLSYLSDPQSVDPLPVRLAWATARS